MNLARYPRRRYTKGQTPLANLPRFSQAIGGPNIYIKRDDMLELTGGGNKTRKLEFLVADALAQGADTLITCGGVQSNHCRLTLAAAVREGMNCRLVLSEIDPGSYSSSTNGNVFLYHLLGVEKVKVVSWGADLTEELQKVADEVVADGHKPYIIPMGGSNPLGVLGYVACAEEIMNQAFDMGLEIDHIVLPDGSAGTHSGLLLGLYGNNCNIPTMGISVLNSKEVLEKRIAELVQETAEYMEIDVKIPRDAIVCCDKYIGPGYTRPTSEMIEAVKLLARTEGVLLDPTYTGKAMAGLIDLVKKGVLRKGDNVLFLHTGGSPGLYANTPLFMPQV